MAILTWTRLLCDVHDDCRANPAIGEDCARGALERGEGVPSRYRHDPYVVGAFKTGAAGAPRWIATRRNDRGELEALIETYAGRVVRTHTSEERVMSDVYAPVTRAVVQLDDGSFKNDAYIRAHFECDPGLCYAEEDAAPEVLTAHEAHVAAARAASERAEQARVEALREAERKAPKVGRRVRVVRGRKVERGTEGDCTWIGEGRYGMRVRIRLLDGSAVFTAATNVEAIPS